MKWDWVYRNIIESNILAVFSSLFIVDSSLYCKLLKLEIESSYFILSINLFFPKSLLGTVTKNIKVICIQQ